MNVTSSSVKKSALIGESESQYEEMLPMPCPINSPQLGVGAGRPKPKKSSDVSAKILRTNENGASVIIGINALGRICLKIIARSLAPMALAACT